MKEHTHTAQKHSPASAYNTKSSSQTCSHVCASIKNLFFLLQKKKNVRKRLLEGRCRNKIYQKPRKEGIFFSFFFLSNI